MVFRVWVSGPVPGSASEFHLLRAVPGVLIIGLPDLAGSGCTVFWVRVFWCSQLYVACQPLQHSDCTEHVLAFGRRVVHVTAHISIQVQVCCSGCFETAYSITSMVRALGDAARFLRRQLLLSLYRPECRPASQNCRGGYHSPAGFPNVC